MGKLKGLRRYREGGIYKVKHRATGIQMPAHLPEDHDDFLSAYLDAQRGVQAPRTRGKPRPGSVLDTWVRLGRAPEWTALSPAYREYLARHIEAICQRGGHVQVAAIAERHILADIDGLPPHTAKPRLKAWRKLLGFAKAQRDIERSPAAQVDPIRLPRSTQHPPWTEDEIAAFRARWPYGTDQRRAFELLHWTGARIGDTIYLGPGMIDRDGWLNYTQAKTGSPVSVPIRRDLPDFADPADLAELMAALDAWTGPKHMLWLATAKGDKRSSKSASQWFTAAVRAAGITTGRSAHGLRVTRAISMAEAGATPDQRAAWLGHDSLTETAHYSRQADRRRLLRGTRGEQKLFDGSEIEQNRQVR